MADMSDEKPRRPKGKTAKFEDVAGKLVRPAEPVKYLGSDWEECLAAGRRILARREQR
jgi:hypothetical protein